MLKIRLARIGKKKQPSYRFVISEHARDLYGNHLEILGHYDPFTKVCEVKKDRILYWISKGAKASPTAHNLLIDQNVLTGPKINKTRSKKGAAAAAAPATEATPAAETTPVAEAKPVEEKPAAAAAETPAA